MAASTSPISTCNTYLMYKTVSSGNYEKLCDIKSFPDLGGEPERIDVTTLSDAVRHYIAGVQDLSSFSFTANYISSDYTKIAALSGTQYDYAIWLGATTSGNTDTPDGSDGKWAWTGDIYVFKTGGDVNAAQEMTITAFPSTDFAYTV